MNPSFDLQFGIWRCHLKGTRIAGERIAGFGVTKQQAQDEFWSELRRVWLKAGLPLEMMGS